MAIGAAETDMALKTSDIAFLSDDLIKMPEVVSLSRRTLKVIHQYVGFTVFLILAVVAAGLGWISPIGGAVIKRRDGRHHQCRAAAAVILLIGSRTRRRRGRS